MSRIIINEFEVVPTEAPSPRERRATESAVPPTTPEEVRELVTRHLERMKRVLAD
jgi:hypothetical protein